MARYQQRNNQRVGYDRDSGVPAVDGRDIDTYFINKKHDFKTPLCNTCPEIECVFAEGEYSIPEDTTICARKYLSPEHLWFI